MSVLVIGGTGFIGLRVIRLLVARGEQVTCMDINPGAAAFTELGDQVQVIRGDVTQFDDVVAAMKTGKPSRAVNLSYHIGSEHAPHIATKLNIVGMDNFFEAGRLCDVPRLVYASSLAVNGMQKHYGERMITETDYRHGDVQYAIHKMFNEWQAQDYNEKHGMTITGIRPANVTGPDKIRGSVDHVNCITAPARGKAVTFPYKDAMRCPVHVDDIAEVFTRVLLTDNPRHSLYNTGGTAISLGELADLVRSYLPDADIRFDHDSGGRASSGNFLIDNRPPRGRVRRPVQAVPRTRAADHQRNPRAGKPACNRRLKETTMSTTPTPNARDALRQLAPKLIELTDDVLFGDIWERPGLSKRDRSLITVAALIATYRPGQMPGHMQRALDNGVTKDEIIEMITHLAFYAGWPASMSAAQIAKEVFGKA